jgi:hypothetical protein
MKKKTILLLCSALIAISVIAQTKSSNSNQTSRFWGTECKHTVVNGYEYESCCFYVFWIATNCWEGSVVMNPVQE